MAEGIDDYEMPSFDLNPGAEAKKRPTTSSDGREWSCSVLYVRRLNSQFCTIRYFL